MSYKIVICVTEMAVLMRKRKMKFNMHFIQSISCDDVLDSMI